MFKTEIITFRTSRELREWLDQAGRASRCSRSSFIETVLRDFLASKKEGVSPPESSEAGAISSWSVSRGDGGETKILMLGGVRIALPGYMPVKISFDEGAGAFQIELAGGEKIKVAPPRTGGKTTPEMTGAPEGP
jgi:hypothetical protein